MSVLKPKIEYFKKFEFSAYNLQMDFSHLALYDLEVSMGANESSGCVESKTVKSPWE